MSGEQGSKAGVRMDRVGVLTCALMTVVMLVMLGRVAQLQIHPGEALAQNVQQRISGKSEPAVRGDLMDRRGRLIATSRFGYRAFVDPTEFPDPPDEAIGRLAEAIGGSGAEIGEKIVVRMADNAQREAERAEAETDEQIRGLLRYVVVSGLLEDGQIAAVRDLKLPGVHLEQRAVRSYPGGQLAASLIGKVGFEHTGLLGAEYALEGRLKGDDGGLRYVRDAWGRPLWIHPDGRRPAKRGEDVRLSIDLELQRLAVTELARGVEEADAAGGRLVMLDPITGEILAIADILREVPDALPFVWHDIDPEGEQPPFPEPGTVRYNVMADDPGRKVHPALGRNRCVEDIYEPGSTFKPFMWSAVTEAGAADPDEEFDTEGGSWRTSYGRLIEDVTAGDTMTWTEVLVNSSNIGMTKGTERLSPEQLHGAIVRFGFGQVSGIGLPGEAAGLVTSLARWNKYTHTSVAFGYEVAVTPVQMVRAFGAFARTGRLAGTLPPVRLTAVGQDESQGDLLHRVLPGEVTELVRQALREVARKMEAKMAAKDPAEANWRYDIFGKSGTAEIPLTSPPKGKRIPRGHPTYFDDQFNSSFIAAGPAESPRLVVLVVIDDPGPFQVRNRMHYGSSVAGPVVRRVLEQGLAYLGVEETGVLKEESLAAFGD